MTRKKKIILEFQIYQENVVYGFKLTYDSTEECYSAFPLPRDETLRQEWIRKVRNAHLSPIKYTCVCEKHFTLKKAAYFM